jgi:hypothetical protein
MNRVFQMSFEFQLAMLQEGVARRVAWRGAEEHVSGVSERE